MLICGFGLVLVFVLDLVRVFLLVRLVLGEVAIMVIDGEKEEMPTNSFDNIVNDNIVVVII